MGAADATLNQGMGLTQKKSYFEATAPAPVEASGVGSHVKSTSE